MRSVFKWTMRGVLPALCLTVSLGCSGGSTGAGGGGGDKGGDKGGANSDKQADGLKPVEFKARGTIKGKVTLAGDVSADIKTENANIETKMKAHADHAICEKGTPEEKEEQNLADRQR